MIFPFVKILNYIYFNPKVRKIQRLCAYGSGGQLEIRDGVGARQDTMTAAGTLSL